MESTPVTNTIVVNFFAGPGCGKSTMSAHLFALLKWDGVDCEMVREFAKDKVWEDCTATLNDQIYVFGKQLHRQYVLEDKVPVVITDSPILLSILYDDKKNAAMKALVLQQFHRNHNINIFLKRRKKYVKNGRMQTLEEAIEKDNELRAIMDDNGIQYFEIDGTAESAPLIADIVKAKLAALDAEADGGDLSDLYNAMVDAVRTPKAINVEQELTRIVNDNLALDPEYVAQQQAMNQALVDDLTRLYEESKKDQAFNSGGRDV